MELKNLRPWAVEIPNVGTVEPGKTVEVDNDLGKSLADQADNWEKITPKRKSTTEGDS